ncbi:MAG: hypothetical protein J7M09_04510 [Deltaproteobacteria bacterium]|nr:hypothetical protein [Candidatus Tharpella sp.]
MIYVHAAAAHNTIPDSQLPDLKSELKALSGKVYRRIDHFIQLAIIGAHKAVGELELAPQTAIFMTSGQGDIMVFDRVRRQRYFQEMLSKPADFVNLSGNSAGFYVASHLGLKGANLFLSHHHFPVQMTLLAAQNELNLGRQEAILVGGVDEWIAKPELAKKLLGVDVSISLGEGSNWLLLKAEAKDALAAIAVEPKLFDEKELHQFLLSAEDGTFLSFSRRFSVIEADAIMSVNKSCKRYFYEDSCAYYETLPLYVLTWFLGREAGRLFHLDRNEGRFMVMMVENNSFL